MLYLSSTELTFSRKLEQDIQIVAVDGQAGLHCWSLKEGEKKRLDLNRDLEPRNFSPAANCE